MTEPRKSKPKKPWWIVGVFAGVLVVVGLFIGVWQFLSPSERRVVVPYSEFVAQVHAGEVDEIRIRDREITFRVRSVDGRASVMKDTIGPIPDQAMIESLKPDDPKAPLPKIVFEK